MMLDIHHNGSGDVWGQFFSVQRSRQPGAYRPDVGGDQHGISVQPAFQTGSCAQAEHLPQDPSIGR